VKGKGEVEKSLLSAIKSKTARVVVVGLGYVGLPVACLFAEAGFPVVGIRRSQDKVDLINRGICPIEGKEPGLAELVAQVVSEGRLRATTDYSVCRDAQTVLIAVETPVDPETKKPAYQALRGALVDLGQHLSRGTMVIIESTVAPGTMEQMVKPILEETSGLRVGADFYLVNCPERVMPGKLLRNIRTLHRVVGGMSPEAAELAVEFYRPVVQADLDAVDCLTAEVVKAMENTYRDVQIAFANEMALLCEDLGADVWQVRELVNKSPYRAMHLPGAGVGGHCIPKDPWLLIANANEGFNPRLVPAARATNEGMPLHIVDLTVSALQEVGKDVAEARVLVMGYAYLENSDDTRNSPSAVLVEQLGRLGAEVVIHDPYVPEYRGALRERAQGCDVAVVMVRHDEYVKLSPRELLTWLDSPVLVDGRQVFRMEEVRDLTAAYRVCGVGR
jgi:UDP-N-acetyl-D-mannosaminuronic acid dehydrogenase